MDISDSAFGAEGSKGSEGGIPLIGDTHKGETAPSGKTIKQHS